MADPAGFIGREREVVHLTDLLNDGRSLALVGPAGIGKSSLLIHLLHAAPVLLDRPPQTVLLDLATVRAPDDFYRPVLQAVGREGDDELTLAQSLQEGQLLLGLDNLERAAPGFNRVVRSALRALSSEGRLQLIIASAHTLADVAPDLSDALIEERIEEMPEREARALVAEMLARAGVEASAPEVGLLVGTAGGHPARLRRATELWLRSERGTSFDWQRSFHEQHPTPARLAGSVGDSREQLATEAGGSQARLIDRARARFEGDKHELRTYESEDISAFLLCIVVIATLVLAVYLPSAWPTRLLSCALVFLLLVIAVPWVGMRRGWHRRAGFHAYLEGLHMIPGVRSLLKRLEK